MKKMTNIWGVLSLLVMMGLYGCYKDLGNYDYKNLAKPAIIGLEEKYTVYTLVDTLRVEIEVTPADREYDYLWYACKQTGSFVYDTLARTKNLEYEMDWTPGNYRIIVEARDRETGVVVLEARELAVQTMLTTGWYVLRTQEGMTDLDVFSERGKAENVLAANNGGKRLRGNALALDFLMRYWTVDEETLKPKQKPSMFVLTDEDFCVISSSNGKFYHEFDEFFFELPPRNPQAFHGDSQGLFLQNNGKLYTSSVMSYGSGRLSWPKSGEYRLSEFSVLKDWNSPLFYDEMSSSFCTADYHTDGMYYFNENKLPGIENVVPSVNNMNAELLFLDVDNVNNIYALMKKEENYLMLRMQTGDIKANGNNPVRRCDTLSLDLGLLDADFRTVNQGGTIMYYSKGNTIYSCNMEAGYEEKEQEVISADEKITWMKQVKFEYPKITNWTFDYLCVATYKAGKYKVYFYELQAGHLMKNPDFLEGEGCVGAVYYLHNELQTLNNYQ